jgi:hypothetical protein
MSCDRKRRKTANRKFAVFGNSDKRVVVLGACRALCTEQDCA